MNRSYSYRSWSLNKSAILKAIQSAKYIRHQDGFSVAYVLTAALILIAGTVTLLNQSSSSMLGSIFQGQSLQARNVARSGMAYLISQINKEQNRHLLVLPESQKKINPDADSALWTDIQAATSHLNPCTKTYENGSRVNQSSPNLSDLNLGSSRVNDGFFYIADDGAISKVRNGSTRAFRIVNRPNSKDFKIPIKSGSSLSLLDDTKNSGVFRLSVEAVVYRNGQSNQIASSTILQEDFSVIPKCCKISFGSQKDSLSNALRGHGNSSYALNRYDLAGNRCMLPGLDPDGFGIVVRDSIEADGATIKNSQGVSVNPVYCISADPAKCSSADNTSANQMERLDIHLPDLPKYPGNWEAQQPAPVLKACTSIAECPSNQLVQYNSSNRRTIFNAAAITSAAQLPSNCTMQGNDIHCIYGGIDLTARPDDLIFVTGNNTRRIRLYFSAAGNVINQPTDGGTLRHCKVASCSGPGAYVDNTTDVSFFGSSCPYDSTKPNECGEQNIIIKGSVREARFFIYAPEASVKLIGGTGSTFQGVIWANRLDIRGTSAIPTMPKTGVADVFILMGMLPDDNDKLTKSIAGEANFSDLFPLDMVARSTSRYRFFGN